MMVNAICYKSRNFNQTNQFASNLNGLIQHVQGETCSLSGSNKKPTIKDKAKHFIQTSPEIWLNMKGEGGKIVKGEVQVKAKQHDVPWRIQGDYKDCHYDKNPNRQGSIFKDPCDSCGYENPKFKPKNK